MPSPSFVLDLVHLASWPDCVYRLAVNPFVCEWRAAIQHSVSCGFSAQEICCRRHMLCAPMLCVQDSPVVGQGGLDPQGARLRQQLVPAPERIWALRNVANSMLRSTASSGGSGSSGSSTPSAEEAVSMLHQAADLAAEHYGKNHPGVSMCEQFSASSQGKSSQSQLDCSGDSICSYWLQWHHSIMSCLCGACSETTPPCFHGLVAGCLSPLLDYVGAMLVVPGHQAEAKTAIEAVCAIVAAVGERYRQQKDLLSLVVLYESTQAGG